MQEKYYGWLAKYYDSNDEAFMRVTHQISFFCTENEINDFVEKARKEGDGWVRVYKAWSSYQIN